MRLWMRLFTHSIQISFYIILQSEPMIRINDEFNKYNIPYSDEILMPQVFVEMNEGEVTDYRIWNLPTSKHESVLSRCTSTSIAKYEYP